MLRHATTCYDMPRHDKATTWATTWATTQLRHTAMKANKPTKTLLLIYNYIIFVRER
jgi:hypothetical protein